MDMTLDQTKDELTDVANDLDIDFSEDTEEEDTLFDQEVERRTQEKLKQLREQSAEELKSETLNRKLTQVFLNQDNTKDLLSFLKALNGSSREVVMHILTNTKPVQIGTNVAEVKTTEVVPADVLRDKVLDYLKTKWSPVPATLIWDELGISKEVLKEPLKSLIGLGLVTTEGTRRGTRYLYIRPSVVENQQIQAEKQTVNTTVPTVPTQPVDDSNATKSDAEVEQSQEVPQIDTPLEVVSQETSNLEQLDSTTDNNSNLDTSDSNENLEAFDPSASDVDF